MENIFLCNMHVDNITTIFYQGLQQLKYDKEKVTIWAKSYTLIDALSKINDNDEAKVIQSKRKSTEEGP